MSLVYFIISIFTSSSSFISLLNSFDPQGQNISASLVNATVQAQKTNTKISKFTSNVELRKFYLLCVCLIVSGIFLVVSFSFPLIS